MLGIFIVIVIFLYVFHGLSSRISRLEKLLEGKVVAPNNAANPMEAQSGTPAPSSNSMQQAKSMQPIANVYPNPQNINTAKPVVTKEKTEESSGRLLGNLGIAAVLIGLAFFLNYAFDNNWIGETGRVMIGVFIGIVFLGLGQWLRAKYLKYSDLLMGGGIAILYLSVYAAHSFYGLIDPFMTSVLMFCVTFLGFAISIVNATITLATVATVGGFATPFLVGSDSNNMMEIFGYMTLLNVGVLSISFFKKWPQLVVIAFVGTWLNYFTWAAQHYNDTLLGPTLFFLTITFIVFIFANIARSLTASVKADTLDYLLLGGNAFGYAFVAYSLLQRDYHSVLGFGAVVIALIYIFISYLTNKRNGDDKALNIFLPGLAVTFLSLAVPLQFSGPWIAVAWLVESCFLYGIASYISNRGFQVMGVVVYCLGLMNFFYWGENFGADINFVPIFNKSFIVLMLAVVVAYIIAYMYKKFGSISVEIQKRGITAFVVIANILTIYAFSTQIIYHYRAEQFKLEDSYQKTAANSNLYNTGYDNSIKSQQESDRYYTENRALGNQSNIYVSILWALYAAILTGIGFAKRIAGVRRLGLILFILTGIKVVIDVWALGEIYRIISFIVFGLIALMASFVYAKYKDRL